MDARTGGLVIFPCIGNCVDCYFTYRHRFCLVCVARRCSTLFMAGFLIYVPGVFICKTVVVSSSFTIDIAERCLFEVLLLMLHRFV